MNTLSPETKARVVAALTEGVSIRAAARLCDVDRETVMYLGVRVGEGCARLHDAMMRQLHVSVLELDEQWSFIGCKAKNVRPGDDPARGDCYLHLAFDVTSKSVISYVVGKRDGEHTIALAADLRARITNRPQITADGWIAYPGAIDLAFARDVDFATLVKTYTVTPGNEAAVRYSPGKIRGIEKTIVSGTPDKSRISTSGVERFNLTTRMQSRRFTRLTNGFSRKAQNHRAAIALHIAAYNLTRWHESIRCTPAMALGVTDHIWTIGELVTAALNAPEPPPLIAPSPKGMSAEKAKGASAAKRPRLIAIRGGKKGRKR